MNGKTLAPDASADNNHSVWNSKNESYRRRRLTAASAEGKLTVVRQTRLVILAKVERLLGFVQTTLYTDFFPSI